MRRSLLVGSTLLTLAACAETPTPPTAEPPPPQMGPGIVAGNWRVTSVNPSGLTPLPAAQQMALENRVLTFGLTSAEDVDGRTCNAPAYRFAQVPQSRALGYRQTMPMMDYTVTEVWVDCHGTPFARFIKLPSGVLLADHHGTYAALEPSTSAADGPLMARPMVPQVQESAVKPMAMAMHNAAAQPGDQVAHLASYRGEGMAREGWGKLSHKYPELQAFHPQYEPVTLAGKGKFVRLMAVGENAQQVAALCQELKKKGAYCRVMTEK
jgi:hypothetical protein